MVTRETLVRGGKACRPLFALDGLAQAFVEPALKFLRERNANVAFGHRLRALGFTQNMVTALNFGDDRVAIGVGDGVVLATPPAVSADLLPDLKTPEKFRAIVNAHFRIEPPPDLPPLLGIINGTIEWLFSFKHRLSVTISCADRLLDMSARNARWTNLARGRTGYRPSKADAGVADRARAPRNLRGHAR